MPTLVRPATPERWADLIQVFGRRGADESWCWCQVPLSTRREALGGWSPDNRSALRGEIDQATVPPGLIGYVSDEPAGWIRIGPRAMFPRVDHNRALARVLDPNPGAWWVACFVVNPDHRRRGVASALLEAAVGFARDHGATAVEGHPVDVDRLTAHRVGGSALFTGTMALFAGAGFVEVGRTFPSRPVMRRFV